MIYRDFFKSNFDLLRLRIPQDALKSCWAEQNFMFFFFFFPSSSIGKQDKNNSFISSKVTANILCHYTRVRTTPLAGMPLLQSVIPVAPSCPPRLWVCTSEEAHWLCERSPAASKEINTSFHGVCLGSLRGKKRHHKTKPESLIFHNWRGLIDFSSNPLFPITDAACVNSPWKALDINELKKMWGVTITLLAVLASLYIST